MTLKRIVNIIWIAAGCIAIYALIQFSYVCKEALNEPNYPERRF